MRVLIVLYKYAVASLRVMSLSLCGPLQLPVSAAPSVPYACIWQTKQRKEQSTVAGGAVVLNVHMQS